MRSRLERLFEEAEHPVYVLDPANDRIVDTNRAGYEFLGYTYEELLATPVSAIHPAELPLMGAWARQAMESGHGWTTTFNCRTKSGDILPTEMEMFAPDPNAYVFVFVRGRSGSRKPAA